MTGGGLVFVATSSDRKLRAYDEDTGKVVWETKLPAAAEGVPAAYEVGGRQYIALCVAGGNGLMARGALAPQNSPPGAGYSIWYSRSRRSRSSGLQLDANQVDLHIADVFDRVWRKELGEVCRAARRSLAAIEGDVAVLIAPNKIAGLDCVINRRPAVRMHRHGVAHGNARIQHPHPLVFEDQFMMPWSGNHRVQGIGPRPRIRAHSYCFLPRTCLALPPLSSV